MKRVAILGSTGSIGVSTLKVIRQLPENFKAVALSSYSGAQLLVKQARDFRPESICIGRQEKTGFLKSELNNRGEIFSGEAGLLKMLENKNIDLVVLAISGSAALMPLLKAIENKKNIALANKEALVMAGQIIMQRARQHKVKIIPIDSEQSAIWQCLEGQDLSKIKNIYLTASGGPFRSLSRAALKKVTLKKALEHPRWKMGPKITVDSATLMNKGLEIFEAMHLFGVSADKIKVLIHPESIIHSMVEFVDGVVMAQLSVTDMRIPIQYALSYPQRLKVNIKPLDFVALKCLNFAKPDFNKFSCLKLAYRAAGQGGTAPAVLNAANEVAVDKFLKNKLSFIAIPKIIAKVLAKHKNIKNPGLNDILRADKWARQEAFKL